MAVSKSDICNLGLSHIKQTTTTIANLDTDTGVVAAQCRIHYDVCRQMVLADHWWNFALKRVTLSEEGTAPSDWIYRYDYPSGCLNFREIERDTKLDLAIPFQIEQDAGGTGLSIVTDKYQAIGLYTTDVENTALFSPGFVHSLGWLMASELAFSIAGNLKLQEQCLRIYRASYGASKAVNSNEDSPVAELESPWEQARQNGGS